MALGMGGSQSGGVMAPADVHGAGESEWAITSGVPPTHPLVGGPDVIGLGTYDVDRGRSRIVTTPQGQLGPAGGPVMASPDPLGVTTPGVEMLDSWRDIFNFRGSPMPWLLIGALLILGLMEFRLQARARAGPASAGASAALG